MTRLEEAQINAGWADAMLAKGNFPVGYYPGLVEQMKAEFEAIIADEQEKITNEEGATQ